LVKLKALAEQRAFDELRVYDLDRLTRADDLRERAQVFGILLDAGAVIVDRHGKETNPADARGMGELDYYLRTFFASQERRKIKDRTIDGRKRTAAAGHKPQGATPYGLTYDPVTKAWGIHEERAAVVRSIFRWAADGMSITRITERLSAEGVPSPSGRAEWSRARVHEFLRDALYKGQKVYKIGTETFPCDVPPIVPEYLWNAAQAGLSRRNNVPQRDEYRHPALLRQRAVCGTCGAPLYVDSSRNREAYRQRYKCSSKNRGEKCGALTHQILPVDEALWRAVSEALRDPKWIQRAVERQRSKVGQGEWETQIKACERKLAEIKKKETSIL
jgi:hypothetical protein